MPELAGVKLEPWGEGDFVRAYQASGRIVRVPKHPAARVALEREACLLPFVAGRVPVPVPVPVVATSRDGRHAVAVHATLPGEELWSERWAGLAEPDRQRLAARTGEFLRVLHELDPDHGRRCGLVEATPGAVAAQIRRRLAVQGQSIPARLHPPLARCLADLQAGRAATGRRLLHGDFGPGHTLHDPVTLELTGVIDWGDAFIGEPARDFIFVYEDWGDAFLRLAVDAYGPSEPGRLLERVYLHYLADQLQWVLGGSARSPDGIRAGIEGLERALGDLRRVRAEG